MAVLKLADPNLSLTDVIDRVIAERAPITLAREDGEIVVISPMDETEYLLSTPANAEALLKSIAELDAGHGVERQLLEP